MSACLAASRAPRADWYCFKIVHVQVIFKTPNSHLTFENSAAPRVNLSASSRPPIIGTFGELRERLLGKTGADHERPLRLLPLELEQQLQQLHTAGGSFGSILPSLPKASSEQKPELRQKAGRARRHDQLLPIAGASRCFDRSLSSLAPGHMWPAVVLQHKKRRSKFVKLKFGERLDVTDANKNFHETMRGRATKTQTRPVVTASSLRLPY